MENNATAWVPDRLIAAQRAYGVLCDLAYHDCFRGKAKAFSEANETIDVLADVVNRAYGNP